MVAAALADGEELVRHAEYLSGSGELVVLAVSGPPIRRMATGSR